VHLGGVELAVFVVKEDFVATLRLKLFSVVFPMSWLNVVHGGVNSENQFFEFEIGLMEVDELLVAVDMRGLGVGLELLRKGADGGVFVKIGDVLAATRNGDLL